MRDPAAPRPGFERFALNPPAPWRRYTYLNFGKEIHIMSASTSTIPITLPPTVVDIESPRAGAVWHVGNAVTIQFLGTGQFFHVRLSFDGGQTFMQIGDIPGGTPLPPQGYTLSYTVPNHVTNQALVRVEAISTINGVEERAHRDSGLFTIAPHK
jgi:hypothetical protein